MLGGLRVRLGEQTLTHFRTQKTTALLAYLALHGRRVHHRETLAELLWPEHPEPATRRSLSTALWSLRQQLGELSRGAADALRTDRNTVSLRPDVVQTDVEEFEKALDTARTATDVGARVAHLTRALDLYEGEFLHGLYEDWVFPEQARLEGLYQQALAEACSVLETLGDWPTALRYATQAVTLEPLCQEARYRLMHLYASAGQSQVALAHYAELKRLLRRELDVDPQIPVQQLAARIGRGEYPLPPHNSHASPGERPRAPGPGSPPIMAIGGAVPKGSSAYAERPTDAEFTEAVASRSSIVLVKGPRQSGKTSLLVRGVQAAREAGLRVVFTDLQTLGPEQLETPDTLYRGLSDSLAEQLELKKAPAAVWDTTWGASLNFRHYLRRWVLREPEKPLLWILDEVDRLFTRPYYGEVFGLFRSWHNERASDPEGPWSYLTLALAYSTEAHLFIPDLDQSPFNVGVRLEVDDLAGEQIAELNQRFGSPLRNQEELGRFQARLGGHPYLVQRGLHELRSGGWQLADLENSSVPFGDHLRGMVSSLRRDPGLCAAVRALLQGERGLTEESFFRLRSAGIIRGGAPDLVRIRCGLYEDYLRQHLSRD